MAAAELLPPVPDCIQGQHFNIEFVSVMAQAQRAGGITANDRLLSGLAQVAQIKPEVTDTLMRIPGSGIMQSA